MLPHLPLPPGPFTSLPSNGILMFADASGFTKLTNILSADNMSVVLSDFFTSMIEIIEEYGGDVLKFAGDALIVYFSHSKTLEAVKCGIKLISKLNHFKATSEHTLSLHIAILKLNNLKSNILGTETSRLEFVVSSNSIVDSGIILDNTVAGEMGVNDKIVEEIECLKVERIGGSERGEYFKVINLGECSTILLNPTSPPPPSPLSCPLIPSKHITPFTPYPVTEFYAHKLSTYLSSLRIISTIFVSLPAGGGNEQFKKCMKILKNLGGMLRQYCVDDKSNVFIAIFGATLMSRSDDTSRSLEFSLRVRSEIKCDVGVSRGLAYCGVLGSKRSSAFARHYVRRQVIVDEETFQNLKHHPKYSFKDAVVKSLKGFGKVNTYSVTKSDFAETSSTETDDEASAEILRGQDELIAKLSNALTSDNKSTNRIALTAPTGHGKSLLLRSIPFPPNALVNSVRVELNAKTTPWSSARRLLRTFRKYTEGMGEEDKELLPLLDDVFKKRGGAESEGNPTTTSGSPLRRRASLTSKMRSLSSVDSLNSPAPSPVNTPPNPNQMDLSSVSGESRQKLILNLLTTLVLSYQTAHPDKSIYLLVDDSENVDAATSTFLTNVDLPNLHIIFATSKDHPECFQQIKVPPLGGEEVLEIFKDVLKAPAEAEVEKVLGKAFVEASNGCATYAKTLTEYLKRNRLLVGRRKTTSEIRLNERGMEKLETLSEAITSHLQSLLDSTTPESGLLIKAASILPVDFEGGTLTSLYTKLQKSPPPHHATLELLQSGLLRETNKGDDGSTLLSFSNMQVRAQVYSSLTSAQRLSLHSHYLNILEEEHAPSPFLFHHAVRAEISVKTLDYGLEAALEQKRAFLLKDALVTIETAAEFLPENLGGESTTVDEMVIHVEIIQLHGELLCLSDRSKEGQPHLEKALELSGETYNENSSLNVQKALQKVHLNLDLREGEFGTPENVEQLSKVLYADAEAYDRLARVYFQSGAIGNAMHAVFRGLNLAEILGHPEKLAKAYSTIAFVTKRVDYAEKAQRSAATGSPTSAFCSMVYGGMLIGEGDFAEAEDALTQSIKICETISDFATKGLSMSVLGWAFFVQGKFEGGLSVSEKMLDFGKAKGDARFIAWGRNSSVRDLIALGRKGEAQLLMVEIEAHIEAEGGLRKFLNSDQVHFAGFRIRFALLEGSRELVEKALMENRDVVDKLKKPCTQLVEFAGCCSIIEGLLVLSEDEDWHATLDEVLTAFEGYTKAYPIFASRLSYYKARLETANEGEILKGWNSAEHYSMTVEKALLQKIAEESGVVLENRGGRGGGKRATVRTLEEKKIDGEELRKVGREIGQGVSLSLVEVCDAVVDVWGGDADEPYVLKVVEDAKAFVSDYVLQCDGEEKEGLKDVSRDAAAVVELVFEHAKSRK
ncbi:hypothetical protein TL16_g05837 [Triparma laevis f. inornata]|uniref:Guanylate cyclase domain-containing protein n=1 Tax=Triparma laevis f. inornata TaxID=1714386 RepID=A0A9W7E8C6_9STRA|nr:hypothetical protein TL16_g05837 [Triparma laevis f. inornata]